jgi:hypothetical protein
MTSDDVRICLNDDSLVSKFYNEYLKYKISTLIVKIGLV